MPATSFYHSPAAPIDSNIRRADASCPRGDQCARCRQRVTHKFAIYPKRFGDILCTGCGRCARACPGGQDLPETLARIATMQADGKVSA